MKREPALTPRVFCDTDAAYFAARLDELPSTYKRLQAELRQQARRGRPVRVPFGSRLPLRADVDAQMRLLGSALCTWEARVRRPARLTPRDPWKSYLDPGVVDDAVGTLTKNLSPLLALPPAWMCRTLPMAPGPAGKPSPKIPADIEDVYGECEIVSKGADTVTVMALASGEDAGNELLRLHYLARRVLGETRPAPESFDGIPCRSCGDIALERAEPPSNPERPAMHSRCASCQHEMDRDTYYEWAKWYSMWADGATLTCRRCETGNCHLCIYDRCACQSAAHPAAGI